MKRAILTALTFAAIGAAHAETLETASFIINIDNKCSARAVSCDNVIYTGTSKKTGKSITLRGSTLHSTCDDGVSPCRFQGYSFDNGRTSYFINASGELTVTQGKKTLVSETGEWKR